MNAALKSHGKPLIFAIDLNGIFTSRCCPLVVELAHLRLVHDRDDDDDEPCGKWARAGSARSVHTRTCYRPPESCAVNYVHTWLILFGYTWMASRPPRSRQTEQRNGKSVNQRQASPELEHVWQVPADCLSRRPRLDDSAGDFQTENTAASRVRFTTKQIYFLKLFVNVFFQRG